MTQEETLDILKLGYNVFLTGPPGSGKTFLLNKYIDYLRGKRREVAVTASTGIAATHMNGVTIHSWSGMGIKEELTGQDIKKLLKKSYLRKRFRDTNILIIDEISMLHAFQFDLINQICQAFKDRPEPFGGMQIVCSGDLFQLPPVQKDGEAKFITESEVWNNMDMKICYLEEQHRQESGKLLALLNCIRNNSANEARELLINSERAENQFPIISTKLYTHNVDVDAINQFELSKIEGKEFVYPMQAEGNKNIVAALKKGCLAPERLVLKRNAKVMFIKNNFNKGYVNGTLGKVIRFDKENRPIIETLRGRCIVAIPTSWTVEEEGVVIAKVSQIPLRLAWAITIHKSQGMNLDAAEIDLSKSFVRGMGYVALSRLRSLTGLKLMGINDLAFLVKKEAVELDKSLKQMSQQTAEEIKDMNSQQKKKGQSQFLRSLPEDGYIKVKAQEQKEHLSTYEKTKLLVIAKLSIKKIAKRRDLTENTIIRHLEKLMANGEELNLEHLQLPEARFEKIKSAFQQVGTSKLTQVYEILGEDFSYQELKLARLFLITTKKSDK